jgi:hypothetical protein
LLGDDASGRNGGGVEVIAAREFKAMVEGSTLGFGGRHAAKVGDCYFASMDGEPHAYERRGQGDDDEHENLGKQLEESNYANSA